MRKSNKILLGRLAFVFVVGHTLAIVLYAFPGDVIPAPLKSASAVYVVPVFEQTWSLFAPCPVHENALSVNYYFDGDSTGWIEPMRDAREQHAFWRGSYHSDLLLGESNLLHYTANDLEWMGISLYKPFPHDSADSFRNASSYWIMYHYLSGTAQYLYEKRPDSALAACSFHNVKTGESGKLILPVFRWDAKK